MNTRRTRRQFISRHEAGRIRLKFRRRDLRAGAATKKNRKAAIQINGRCKIAGRLRTPQSTKRQNSVHSKAVPPVALRAGHASSGVPASLRLAGVVAGEANISRRFVSSAFHQRNNPLRSNFVTRKSGTKPSYSSRQPALCLAKWPVANRRLASATRRRL